MLRHLPHNQPRNFGVSLGCCSADLATITQLTEKGVVGLGECGHHHSPDCHMRLHDCPDGARVCNECRRSLMRIHSTSDLMSIASWNSS